MPFIRASHLKILAFLCLMSLGTLSAWRGGCERPETQTLVNAPVAAQVLLPPADEAAVTDSMAQYRLARDMELSRRNEALLRLLEAARTDETVRGEAEKELWRLTRIEAAEHEAEAVLAMQGWPEAAVTIVGDEAAVVVSGNGLTEIEAAAIGRLVAKATGVDESAVRILERR
ncbi:MAG: SpoIIIAH-like family protein [Bacteroidota bacterium]